MRLILAGALLLSTAPAMAQPGVTTRASATAQPTPTPPQRPRTRCEVLAADYRQSEWSIADTFTDSLGDNSAPRAAMRAQEIGNALATAAITLQLMRDHRCTPLPTRAPVVGTYLSAALACSSARRGTVGEATPPQCVRENWERSE